MAQVSLRIAGNKLPEVEEIRIYSQTKKLLVTVKSSDTDVFSGKKHIAIHETDIYVVVVYEGLLANVTHKNFHELSILKHGNITIIANGRDDNRVVFE